VSDTQLLEPSVLEMQAETGSPEPAGRASAGADVIEPRPAALPGLLESLLFVAAAPTPLVRLAQALQATQEAVESALLDLQLTFETDNRGVRLLRKDDRVQLTSAPESAPYIERFLGLDLTTRLSQAALETLAVIAYRQPLTRVQVEAIRGVNCDGVLHTLIARGLVEPVGRLEQAGRPFLYGTTFLFLQYFGLDNLGALPTLPEDIPQT
jgi:segregation and condensation protein B